MKKVVLECTNEKMKIKTDNKQTNKNVMGFDPEDLNLKHYAGCGYRVPGSY